MIKKNKKKKKEDTLTSYIIPVIIVVLFMYVIVTGLSHLPDAFKEFCSEKGMTYLEERQGFSTKLYCVEVDNNSIIKKCLINQVKVEEKTELFLEEDCVEGI